MPDTLPPFKFLEKYRAEVRIAEESRSLNIPACIGLASRKTIAVVTKMILMRGCLFIVFNPRRPITLLSWGEHMFRYWHTAVNWHAEVKTAGGLPVALF